MTLNAYSARLDEILRKDTRKPETAPWWVEPLIAGVLAVMVGLICAC